MGLSSKKQTTKASEKSSTVQNFTTTRNNPVWLEDAMKGFTSGVSDVMGRDPTDFVSGADPLQTQAAGAAGALGGWRGALGDATTIAGRAANGTTPTIRGESLLSGLDDYMSPYLKEVVDATAADLDVDAGRTRAAQAASGARSGAFGGSRFGVREAQTEGELSRARATSLGTLRDQGFARAADLSDRDAARRQQASMSNQSFAAGDLDRQLSAGGLMGELSNLGATNARSDIDSQLAAGETMRGIDTERRQAPLGLLGAVGDLLGSAPYDLLSGSSTSGTTDSTGSSTSTTKVTPGLIDQIGQAVQIAAAAASMSDASLKRDVETLGFDDAGRRWVSWRWNWDDDDAEPVRGLIAQETLATDPAAVLEGADGFLRIDYSQVEIPTWLHS